MKKYVPLREQSTNFLDKPALLFFLGWSGYRRVFSENLTLAKNDKTKRLKQYKYLKNIVLHEKKLYCIEILYTILIGLTVKLMFENCTIFFPPSTCTMFIQKI